MKTVTGTAVCSNPISLSKAASTLSSFLSADNGASKALCAYLSRVSASFNELKQLHKDLKSQRRDRKHRIHRSEFSTDLRAADDSSHRIGDGEKIKSPVSANKSGKKRRENKNPTEDEQDGETATDNGEVVGELKIEVESSVVAIEKKKKKKNHKNKSEDGIDGEDDREDIDPNGENDRKDLVELSITKKKKKRRGEYGDELQINNGGTIEKDKIPVTDGKELKRKERKKRKNRGLEEQEGSDNGSEEQRSTKRRKGNL